MTTTRITEQQAESLVKDFIPLRYHHATTDNDTARTWISNPQGVLYLYGPTGTGKSHTSWATVREYIFSLTHTDRYGWFVGGSVTSVLELMKPGQISDDERGSCLDPKERAARGGLLFLDDLGASKITDWALDTLFYILDTRYNLLVPTIVASNLMPGDELTELVGDRIVSRLAEDATLIRLTGEDRRLTTTH